MKTFSVEKVKEMCRVELNVYWNKVMLFAGKILLSMS
jgi:hypothetical protein